MPPPLPVFTSVSQSSHWHKEELNKTKIKIWIKTRDKLLSGCFIICLWLVFIKTKLQKQNLVSATILKITESFPLILKHINNKKAKYSKNEINSWCFLFYLLINQQNKTFKAIVFGSVRLWVNIFDNLFMFNKPNYSCADFLIIINFSTNLTNSP